MSKAVEHYFAIIILLTQEHWLLHTIVSELLEPSLMYS